MNRVSDLHSKTEMVIHRFFFLSSFFFRRCRLFSIVWNNRRYENSRAHNRNSFYIYKPCVPTDWMRNEGAAHVGHLVSGHWDGVLPASYSTRNGCGKTFKNKMEKSCSLGETPSYTITSSFHLRNIFLWRSTWISIDDAEVAGDIYFFGCFLFFNASFLSIPKIINKKRKCFSICQQHSRVLLQCWYSTGKLGFFKFQDPEQSGFAETAFQFVFVEKWKFRNGK